MMAALRTWITAVVSVSVLVTLTQSLIPEGTIRKIASMTGGLLLMIVLLLPIKSLNVDDLQLDYGDYEQEIASRQEELQTDSDAELAKIIAEKSGAYIKAEAAKLGIACNPKVETQTDAGGTPYPDSVELDCGENAQLQRDIAENLGIPTERQVYYGTENGG